MLVYANSFIFEPEHGAQQIIQLIARWVGQRAKSYVAPERLSEGIRELHLKDGSTLSSRVTTDDAKQPVHPYFFCARLVHTDDRVSGRRWITEVGLRQEYELAPIECSVLLKTDEVSARVTTPIQVTRPKLVQQLVESCHPQGQTPGLSIKSLTETSAAAFLREVERDERLHPLVLISCTRDGIYPVTPERLRTVLVGLADVVAIPESVDTFELQEIVGRRYIAFGGAINILFPMRNGSRGRFCEAVLLRPDYIEALQDDEKTVESEVLAAITHRTNLPYSWRHTSTETVDQALLRIRLLRAVEQAKGNDSSAELEEYIALLEAADKELRSKDEDLNQLRRNLGDQENEARRLQADISGLKHALTGRQSGDESQSDDMASAFTPLRQAIGSLQKGTLALVQALEIVATLFPERIIALETAFASAEDSDRDGFRYGVKALDLLTKLASEYWKTLSEGNGDQQAKAVFGQNAYAPNEASALSSEGKRRRTFSYRGRDFFMEKHLKHGIKDSAAETLRIHFEWIQSEKKIVIGHCGAHLNF